MRYRPFVVRLAVLVLAFATVACSSTGGGQPAEDRQGSTVVLKFWDENAGPSRTPLYLELFRRFHERHPEIEVQYAGIPLSLNKTKYDMAIASNDLPDVASINAEWIADFAAKGVLLALDSYFANWPDRELIGARFIEYNRSLVPDRRLYHIPNTFYFDVFWYRTDWFRSAGLNPPLTWDDVFAAASKLTDPGRNRYGYSLRGGDGSITQLTSLLYAYSGITDYFRADGSCSVNDPKHVEFLKKYAALYKVNTAPSDIVNGYKEMVAAFDSGRAAMIQHNFGSFHDHLEALGENRFAAALLPPAANGKRVLVNVANGYGIFRTTAHPEAAWKLLSFLLSEESQTYWNSHVGQMPTNLKAWSADYVRNTPYLQEAQAALKDPQTGFVRVPFELPNYTSLIKQQVEPNFQSVLAGEMTVEDFLNGWADVMETSYAQYMR